MPKPGGRSLHGESLAKEGKLEILLSLQEKFSSQVASFFTMKEKKNYASRKKLLTSIKQKRPLGKKTFLEALHKELVIPDVVTNRAT